MSSSLTAARMSYAAAVVAILTYGINVVLAGICIYFQMQHRHQTKGKYTLVIYTCLMFIVSTTYFCTGTKWSEIEFVESTVDPAAFAALLSSKISVTKDAASVVNIWLADALMLYRTYVIWGGNFCVIALPFAMFLSTIGSSIVLLIQISKPGAMFGVKLISDLGTAFWSISVSLNVISTLLIAGRLLWHQRSIRQIGLQHSNQYTDIVAVLAESAALYSICGLIYIPLFALNLSLQYPFSALFNSAASIAPNLIVLRMALGIAATDTRTGMSTKMNIASMQDSQLKSGDVSDILSSHASGMAASTFSSTQREFKSVHTLADESPDVYPLDSYKRREVV